MSLNDIRAFLNALNYSGLPYAYDIETIEHRADYRLILTLY